MRTWLAPHIQRALGICLVGILAASATAQVFDTFPQQFDTLPKQTGDQTEELLIEPADEEFVEPEVEAPPVFVRPPAPITVIRAPPMAAAAQPAPSVTTAPVSPAVTLAPIVHTLSFPALALHLLDVQSAIPTDGRESIELMMAVWTPGFSRIEDYARDVQNFTARSLSGEALTVEKPAPNRWRIDTQGEPTVIISYRLLCERNGSVSRSIVSEEYAVICGGP
jgi:hypothetical protein